ncbi:PAS domain-containing protein [Roseicella frigidaeris]|nr:PAS domain-containing protein [Roseicella frigidaeris]
MDADVVPAFLLGGGEMGARIRAHDWSRTSLGPPEGWSAGLKTTVRTALTTRHPVFIFWGGEHLCLYNDAYSASLGPEKHPAILGMPGRTAWTEIWSVIGPQIESVMAGGEATWHENQYLPIIRHGGLQEVYWTYSYGPIHDEATPGGIGGVLVICTETTAQMRSEREKAAEARRLLSLFDQAPGFLCVLRGPDHVFDLVNAAYRALIGGRDPTGLPVREALPEIEGQGYFELLDRVYQTGQAYVGRGQRVLVEHSAGVPAEERFIDFIYQPIRDGDGTVAGILCEGSDVTERRRADETNARLAAIVASTTDAIIAFAADDTRILSWNKGAEALFGYAEAEALGAPAGLLVPPDQPDGEPTGVFHRTMRGERVHEHETVRVTKSGERIPVTVTASRMLASDGRVIGVAAIFRDMRQRKAAEERQALLAREVDHRAKNVLAVVQGLVQLTDAREPAAFKRAVAGRIAALARAHTLLAEDRWHGTDLRTLLAGELAPFLGEHRAELSGPRVALPPGAAQPMAMAIHEMATNALKYGALSAAAGRLAVSWYLASRSDGVPLLRLRWVETGGPPVVGAPGRRGFGSRVLEGTLQGQLGGRVSLVWEASGLICDVEVPLVAGAETAGADSDLLP